MAMSAADKKAFQAGHRIRLREKFCDHKFTNNELLELLLTYAIPRIDVKPIVKTLIREFGSVHKILTATREDLVRVPGVAKNTAIFLKAIYEIMLLDHKSFLNESPLFHSRDQLEKYIKLLLSGKKTEEFFVLYLDSFRRLLVSDCHATGTNDYVNAYPREILKRAMDVNAKFVVLVHNHPDGAGAFSTQDIELTMKIKQVLSVVEIEVLDHLLLSGDILFSAQALMLMR